MRKSKSLALKSNLEETEPTASPTPKPWAQKLKNVGIILGIVAISVVIFIYRDELRRLASLGYAGIFLISLLMNTTLIMPLPTGILTSAMGTVYHPFLVGLLAGTGAALGELSGYFLGRSGRGIVLNKERSSKVEEQMRKYGNIGIALLAFIPNPAFDVVGMVAGALKIPWSRFLFWCWIGKTLKMLAFSYTGSFFNFM